MPSQYLVQFAIALLFSCSISNLHAAENEEAPKPETTPQICREDLRKLAQQAARKAGNSPEQIAQEFAEPYEKTTRVEKLDDGTYVVTTYELTGRRGERFVYRLIDQQDPLKGYQVEHKTRDGKVIEVYFSKTPPSSQNSIVAETRAKMTTKSRIPSSNNCKKNNPNHSTQPLQRPLYVPKKCIASMIWIFAKAERMC